MPKSMYVVLFFLVTQIDTLSINLRKLNYVRSYRTQQDTESATKLHLQKYFEILKHIENVWIPAKLNLTKAINRKTLNIS